MNLSFLIIKLNKIYIQIYILYLKNKLTLIFKAYKLLFLIELCYNTKKN